jgi:hypothetical protein
MSPRVTLSPKGNAAPDGHPEAASICQAIAQVYPRGGSPSTRRATAMHTIEANRTPSDDLVGAGGCYLGKIAEKIIAAVGSSVAGQPQARETIPLSDNSPASPLRLHLRGGERRGPERTSTPGAATIASPAIFPDLIPAKPYCANDLQDGLRILPKSDALRRRHIQLNGPASYTWMTHDIDRPGAYFAHRDANVPEPNVIMVNPENGHAHAAYLMETPVVRHSMARSKPLRYFAAVERGIARRIGADRYYAGLNQQRLLAQDAIARSSMSCAPLPIARCASSSGRGVPSRTSVYG